MRRLQSNRPTTKLVRTFGSSIKSEDFMPETAVKERLSVDELSALYDRIYDIADRLFKKYNPCNIRMTRADNTYCLYHSPRYRRSVTYSDSPNKLCCRGCEHWLNGCTVKCLRCKLFICCSAGNKFPMFLKRLRKLKAIAYNKGLSIGGCYFPKEKWLKELRGKHENKKTIQLQ